MTLLRTTGDSLGRMNWRLYVALLLTAAFPTIYTTVRIYFLGDLPVEWGVNIASQLAWVNLGLEVIQEAIILPLFYLLGKTLTDRAATINKLRTGLTLTAGVYAFLALVIILFAEPLVRAMAQDPAAIPATVQYIRLEMVASIITNPVRFLIIFFILMDWRRVIYTILAIQVVASIAMDSLLLSQLDFSFHVGVDGIAYSNMVAGVATLAYSLSVVRRRFGISHGDLSNRADYGWMREWYHVGKWSGVDSFIRNAFYLVFIIRMMNVLAEQGTYWVANGFIWAWLLLPYFPLADLLKQDTAQGPRMDHKAKTYGYFAAALAIAAVWLLSIPLWFPFFEHVFNVPHPDEIQYLVLILVPFYILFMINTLMDGVLYGKGKTGYLALQSFITNVSVYGIAYLLFLQGIFTPSLTGIALLFGIGIAVDTIVTYAVYIHYLRRVEYRI